MSAKIQMSKAVFGTAQVSRDRMSPKIDSKYIQNRVVYIFTNLKYLICILVHMYCKLDANNFMMAASLRGCLNILGATGTKEIEYIETDYGHTDYLDKICNTIGENLTYDSSRTESQPDIFHSGSAYMYPGACRQGWLLCGDYNSGYGNRNYAGFYCKGIYQSVKKISHIQPLSMDFVSIIRH